MVCLGTKEVKPASAAMKSQKSVWLRALRCNGRKATIRHCRSNSSTVMCAFAKCDSQILPIRHAWCDQSGVEVAMHTAHPLPICRPRQTSRCVVVDGAVEIPSARVMTVRTSLLLVAFIRYFRKSCSFRVGYTVRMQRLV